MHGVGMKCKKHSELLEIHKPYSMDYFIVRGDILQDP